MKLKLKQFREAHGFTQADVAARLNLSSNYYAMIERGDRSINDRNLEAIAKIYGINARDLIESSGDPIDTTSALASIKATSIDGAVPPYVLDLLAILPKLKDNQIREVGKYARFIAESTP